MPQTLHLKLSHLRLIAAIAEHGRLQTAAEALALTQPAASRALAEIERMLGAKLFERRARGMTPTLVGEALARRAQAMTVEMAALAREVEELRGGRGGLVRVGAVTGPAVSCLAPALRRLRAEAPEVEAQVEVAPSGVLVRGLEAGAFDFVIGRLLPESDRRAYRLAPGRAEVVRFVTRRAHPLAQAKGLSLRALAGGEWVIQERGTPVRQAVEEALAKAGAPPLQRVTATSSLLVMMAILSESDAAAPMAEEVARLLSSSSGVGGFVTLDLVERIEVPSYHVIEARGRRLSPAAQRLRALVVEEMETDAPRDDVISPKA